MSHVRMIATGGTIASRSGADGRRAAVRAQELLDTLPDLPGKTAVSVRDVGTRGSFAHTTADVLAVLGEIRRAAADGVDGVVVTHGTDTMEESAFLSDLVHNSPAPVVFTGAQRPFDDPAPDGPANLRDALTVAADPAARGLGTLICFDGVVLAARGAAKSDTLAPHAFTAPGRGPVFRVSGGLVQQFGSPRRPEPLRLDPGLDRLPRVDVVALYLGADAALVRAAADSGAQGVVLAAFGAGNATPPVVEAAAELVAAGIPVLICSRVPAGPVLPLYAGGGGSDLARAGAVFGADLSPWQGRLLLAAALAAAPGSPAELVRDWLRT